MKNLKTYSGSYRGKIVKGVLLVSASATILSFFHAKGNDVSDEYTKVYTSVLIEENDTLASIAQKQMNMGAYADLYDSTSDYIEEICKINDLDGQVHPGNYLIVPQIISTEELERRKEEELSTTFVYTIRPLDTLTSIAATFGDTVEELCERNGISKDDILVDGHSLRVRTTIDKMNMYRWETYKSGEEDIHVSRGR